MSLLFIDMPSGCAGDMLLAALLDAFPATERAARLAAVRDGLAGLHLGPIGITLENVLVGGLRASRVVVAADQEATWDPLPRLTLPPGTPEKAPRSATIAGSTHHPGEHHGHRPYRRIRDLLIAAELPERVRSRAQAVFRLLAEAEAAVHGVDPETVEFHEVGALDAIADIVGVCLLLEAHGIDRVIASPLVPGHGTVRCAHGLMPVPVPAVAEMLTQTLKRSGRQAPWHSLGRDTGELTTPTGAALVCALADEFSDGHAGPRRGLTLRGTGFGAGTKTIPGLVNAVRILVAEAPTAPPGTDEVVELHCQVDDMTGEHLALAMEALLAAGAVDVLVTPVVMKKGRPGHALTVIARPETCAALTTTIFQRTTTLGVRQIPCQRLILPRTQTVLTVQGQELPAKLVTLPDGSVRIKPEAEAIRERFWTF